MDRHSFDLSPSGTDFPFCSRSRSVFGWNGYESVKIMPNRPDLDPQHCIHISLILKTSVVDPDPHWFGCRGSESVLGCRPESGCKEIDQNKQINLISCLPDQDPHWDIKLNSDPNWNYCGWSQSLTVTKRLTFYFPCFLYLKKHLGETSLHCLTDWLYTRCSVSNWLKNFFISENCPNRCQENTV